MNLIKVACATCGKTFFRPRGRVNEAKKFGWRQYCSIKCQSQARLRRIKRVCANPNCGKVFFRPPRGLKKSKSGRNFCSRLCAIIFNGSLRKKVKICPVCGKQFSGRKVFCFFKCHIDALRKTKDKKKKEIVNEIRSFAQSYGRMPLKREGPGLAWRAHFVFGGWNKAIKTAGFEPNPVIFSKKFIAKDGHKCDSFAEKIVDDWLASRKIGHKRNVPYPENKKLTADFVTKNNWIEFLGLNGVIKEYDETSKTKRILSKKYKLSLIEIYPKDLFPESHLSEILNIKK